MSEYNRAETAEHMKRALGSGDPSPARIKANFEMLGEIALDLVESIRGLSARLQKAEQRLVDLEEHPPFEYRGVYEAGKSYPKGSFVTQGGIWYATEDTKQPPGHGIGWKLAVRAGRDGRDGKDAT